MRKYFFSPSTKGFYLEEIHGPIMIPDPDWKQPEDQPKAIAPMIRNMETMIPDDGIEITEDEHAAIVIGQGGGKIISIGQDGKVSLSDPEPLPIDQQWENVRSKRDRLLAGTDFGSDTPAAILLKYRAYRQALRDIPQTFKTPADVVWPKKPA